MKSIIQFKGLYRFLSNFWNSPICYENKIYPTSEHLYQAFKTRDLEIREELRQAKTPGKVKRLARTMVLREDWEEIKDDAMFLVIRLKFLQHPKLMKRLLGTKEILLVEGNYWHDNYWGDCLCPKCRRVEGRNQLGKTLMKIRNGVPKKND